jgi:pimeloyl-ACP methyl ester carboxylesterase
MAAKHPFAGLILETPYARLSDPAQKRYFFIPFIETLMKDKFVSQDKIQNANMPKLFLIAGQDEVVGPKTGMRLYQHALQPKTLKIFPNATHNTLYAHGASAQILEFLDSLHP